MASLKQQLQQHSNALLLISALIVVKFIVMPTVEWQDDTLVSNALLEKRLNKSAFAIDKKTQMQQMLAQSTNQLKKIQQLTFDHQATNRFQLNQQKYFEALFEEFQIEITQLVWQAAIPRNQWLLTQYEVKLRIKGALVNLQKLQAALESQPQWFASNSFNYRLEKLRKNNLGKVTGRMSITMYMQQKTQQNES